MTSRRDIVLGGATATTAITPARFTFARASSEEMSAPHKALKIQRVVIATPSVYGPDNRA